MYYSFTLLVQKHLNRYQPPVGVEFEQCLLFFSHIVQQDEVGERITPLWLLDSARQPTQPASPPSGRWEVASRQHDPPLSLARRSCQAQGPDGEGYLRILCKRL